MIYSAFINGAGRTLSQNATLDLTLNMYLENQILEGAATQKCLYGTAGTALGFDFGDGPVRGQLSIEGFDYIVSAGNVWVKDPLDVVTLLGTVANDGQPVKMVSNTTQIFLRSAGVGYRIGFGAVTAIPAPPWTSLADIEYLDGYFIGLDDDGSPVGGQFFISSPEDCFTWDPLDFSTAPASNNKLRALWVSHNDLLVIGSVTIQPFYDSGNADFPIVPNKSGTMQVGTTAKNSVCAMAVGPSRGDNIPFLLTETSNGHCEVVKIVGYDAQVVSTNAISTIFQSYSKISEATAFTYQLNGHSFLQINFAEASWLYDSTTDRWFKLGWLNESTGEQEAHRAINHAFNNGRHLVGDRTAGIIWILSDLIYSDGNPADSSLTVPLISTRQVLLPTAGTKNMFLDRAEVLIEAGIGDGTGSGAGDDPQMSMRFSGDSGHNFGNMRFAAAGKQGDYTARAVWVSCGMARQPAIEISMSAPVKRCWLGLDIDMTQGIG